MSKNFELLQQIGNDEELFRTGLPKDAAVAMDLPLAQALDQETFESLMERASAMGIFETAAEPPQQTYAEPAEPSSKSGIEKASAAESVQTEPKTLRTPRNPTSRIGEATKTHEPRVRQRQERTFSVPMNSPAEQKPRTSPELLIKEPNPVAQRVASPNSRRNGTLSPPWIESIKGAVKSLEWKTKARSSNGGIGLDVITREEEIRLVQRIFSNEAAESPRMAQFASLENEASCSATCARVAELLAARAEGPVCVVDANFQTPSLHKYFGLENLKGLAEATVEAGPIQNFAQQVPEPDLWLIPSGKAAAQLRFPAMADGLRARMEELRGSFRYVVICSGPLRLETSAMLLSRWMDGVVLVLEANATRRDSARRVKEMLEAANINLLGVVLNNRTFPIPDAIYRRLL